MEDRQQSTEGPMLYYRLKDSLMELIDVLMTLNNRLLNTTITTVK